MSKRKGLGVGEPAGVLLVDKPKGPTSHDIVAKIRRLLKTPRVGHAGTLDPMATGLLVVCVGVATRLSPFLTEASKRYLATVRLGEGTDTLDAEGEIIARDSPEAVAAVDAAAFEAALPAFRGQIQQRAPVFSAIKVDGEPLYARARRGEAVEAPIRTLEISALSLISARPPEFTFEAICSKGTYLRSLGADIAAALGLSGHLTALRRLGAGGLSVEDAYTLDRLEAMGAACAERLVSPLDALAHVPRVTVTEAVALKLAQGQRPQIEAPPLALALALKGEEPVALVEVDEQGTLKVIRGWPQGDHVSCA